MAGVPARSGGRNPVFPGKNTLRRPEGPDLKLRQLICQSVHVVMRIINLLS